MRLVKSTLRQILDEHLTEEEREIILLRYGIGCASQTYHAIADILGVNYNSVSGTEARALRKLRIGAISQLNGIK